VERGASQLTKSKAFYERHALLSRKFLMSLQAFA
jgi:hypothetical protein